MARHTATYSQLYPHIRPAVVNGAAEVVVALRGKLFSVMAFTIVDGKITRVDALIGPERLAALELRIPADEDEAQ